MKPIYKSLYTEEMALPTFDRLKANTPWTRKEGTPRSECFMAVEHPLTYCYDSVFGDRCYDSVPLIPQVENVLSLLNDKNGLNYNVCFLNYYLDGKDNLGWHSDDSAGMNLDHPIAVVSFGTPRYIYWKHKNVKGELPDENKVLLESGSLFIMPAGFQREHVHKIPKFGGNGTGERISLTFRNYKE